MVQEVTAGPAANQISMRATLVVILSDRGGILAARGGGANLEKMFLLSCLSENLCFDSRGHLIGLLWLKVRPIHDTLAYLVS